MTAARSTRRWRRPSALLNRSYTAPRSTGECSALDYQRLYQFRFRNVDQSGRREVWKAISRFVHHRIGAPEKVLDPASGSCEFINSVPAKERWAVDRTAYVPAQADPGVKLIVSDIMEAELPPDYFGGALVSNFLEHLPNPDAIQEFLRRMHGWMATGGRIAILGPNYRYCSRTYWDFADHWVALTHLAIEEHLAAAGFEIEETIPRFLPYSFTGRLPASRGLATLYLRTPPVWRLLGKQFLVIGRKP